MSTAKNMIDMLRRHYLPETKPPGGVFAPEIAAPSSDRRADLIWQGVTAGFGQDLVGHEIKVSRRDLQVELADHTKSDAWMRYCDRWWLVVSDLSLIEGLELPPTWGVMAPPSGRRTRSMTVIVDAPQLKPVDQAPAYLRIATWLHWKLQDERSQHRAARVDLERRDNRIRDLENQLTAAGRATHMSDRMQVITQIVDALGVAYGGGLGDGYRETVSVDEVVEALTDLKAARGRAREVQSRAEYLLGQLTYVRGDLDRLLKDRDVDSLAKLVRRPA
ncbi:hypothetical protein [Amycolatopsis taiwanensis]|uniref:hypothetical protein n=1 Tax=Amycolatopsis taiwanensis TaxID=342230 RepID=UPI0004B7540B|nr:hypothetical protein [Amycolatopsis taiwanensis]